MLFNLTLMTCLSLFSTKDTLSCCVGENIPTRAGMIKSQIAQLKSKTTDKMILVEGGKFLMGSSNFEDSKPLHQVELNSFYMDEHEVTNAQFAEFVKETGYVTVAERELDPKDFPGVDPKMLVAGSAVFSKPKELNSLNNYLMWWVYVPGANWQHPEGPNSSIKDKMNYPVVQVAYEDATAYAKWAGKRLPTEAEWEYAARGRKDANDDLYYWGKDLKPNGKWTANIYQGKFPVQDSKEDGFEGTAPVKSFQANALGLYDMEGNVWEWCADFYRPDYYQHSTTANPKGPQDSYDPQEPNLEKRVQRGGSFLCNDQYCERYKAGSRGKGEVNSPTNNVGFRCVKDIN
ncbi:MULTISPECIES: formylglycine-generating enzyme family protein [Sphingobacterium]|uniref:Sulfatase modifying factor 1 n=2 Tax=Sphingobacterium TaxID=28453 RepID=A0ABU0UC84_9SPHI|nr:MULTISPECIES: formylglycine-generating enzyme family protein [Sphingobacterium]MDQ1152469.1 sulfatase modifying factor 1 [Sphingobacterium zeae]